MNGVKLQDGRGVSMNDVTIRKLSEVYLDQLESFDEIIVDGDSKVVVCIKHTSKFGLVMI